MIISTYTEEHILAELLKDYPAVKRFAKKIADKYLMKVQKSGGFIRKDEFWSIPFRSENNNNWFITLVYNQSNKIPWYFSSCCIVEGPKRSKDYYVVRGVNTDSPYFVQFTTHALLRFRERNNEDEGRPLEDFATQAFAHRETAIAAPYVDIKYQMLLAKMEDSAELEGMNYFFLTNIGIYYGYKTPGGNYIFKTFVSTNMAFGELRNLLKDKSTKYKKEAMNLHYMSTLHMYYNKFLYDEEVLDAFLYREIGKDTEFELNKNSPIFLLRH